MQQTGKPSSWSDEVREYKQVPRSSGKTAWRQWHQESSPALCGTNMHHMQETAGPLQESRLGPQFGPGVTCIPVFWNFAAPPCRTVWNTRSLVVNTVSQLGLETQAAVGEQRG